MTFHEYVRNVQRNIDAIPGDSEDKAKLKASLAYTHNREGIKELQTLSELRLVTLRQRLGEYHGEDRTKQEVRVAFFESANDVMRRALQGK
jgi:hypothetical protein